MQCVQLFSVDVNDIGLFSVISIVLMNVVQKFVLFCCSVFVQCMLNRLVNVNRFVMNSMFVVYMVILLIYSMKWKLQMQMISMSIVNIRYVVLSVKLLIGMLVRLCVLLMSVLFEFYIVSEKNVIDVSSVRNELMIWLWMLKCVLDDIGLLVLLCGLNRFIGVRMQVLVSMLSMIVQMFVLNDRLISMGKLLSIDVENVLQLLNSNWNRLIGCVQCDVLGMCLKLNDLICVILFLFILFLVFCVLVWFGVVVI